MFFFAVILSLFLGTISSLGVGGKLLDHCYQFTDFIFHYDLKAYKVLYTKLISICFPNNSIVEAIKQNANKLPWQYVTEGINIFSIDLSFLNEKSGMRKLCIFPNVYRQTYYSTDTTFSVPVHKLKWYVLYYFVKHELWIIIQNIYRKQYKLLKNISYSTI